MADDKVHWFSIVNSLMIVIFLSGMVAMIMLRVLYRDISKYNQLETQEEAQEETGWRLVHGDVFRPPLNSDLLCVYVETGVQFFGMILIAMIFVVLVTAFLLFWLMTTLLLPWVLWVLRFFCFIPVLIHDLLLLHETEHQEASFWFTRLIYSLVKID
ncbi:Nonaspanin (TM9SF) [Cynara cardunculus var. scolymus]|uniref:Transmembrane 9 superfamily member n=1 Tax=Cynara cardunculus var. scolymus TaxID=59895 RepID=A0A103XXJ9_CYNCS|nr:Nonaspanin (TM9SF) [Cynara cardunculus var. scolymus]